MIKLRPAVRVIEEARVSPPWNFSKPMLRPARVEIGGNVFVSEMPETVGQAETINRDLRELEAAT